MSIRISISDETENSNVTVRVAGMLDREAAQLLKKTCIALLNSNNVGHLNIDLEELSFLGEDAARLLCELKKEPRLRLENAGFLTSAMLHDSEGN